MGKIGKVYSSQLKHVFIFEKYWSPNATRGYARSPQYRPLPDKIDLSEVEKLEDLKEIWNSLVRQNGTFILRAFIPRKGTKSLAKIEVINGELRLLDKRKYLARLFKKNKKNSEENLYI